MSAADSIGHPITGTNRAQGPAGGVNTCHKSGGSDAIKLDELAAPTDVTTLNASTSAHGLMPKGDGNAVHFYNGALNQVAPPYDILCGIVAKPSNSEIVLLFVAPRAFRIPANAAGSYLKAGPPPPHRRCFRSRRTARSS
jgi:hypothetical protein